MASMLPPEECMSKPAVSTLVRPTAALLPSPTRAHADSSTELAQEAGWGRQHRPAGLTWTDRDIGMSRESFRGRPFFFFSTVSTSRSSFRLESEEGLATGTLSSLSLLLSRGSRGLSSFTTRFCSFNLHKHRHSWLFQYDY